MSVETDVKLDASAFLVPKAPSLLNPNLERLRAVLADPKSAAAKMLKRFREKQAAAVPAGFRRSRAGLLYALPEHRRVYFPRVLETVKVTTAKGKRKKTKVVPSKVELFVSKRQYDVRHGTYYKVLPAGLKRESRELFVSVPA